MNTTYKMVTESMVDSEFLWLTGKTLRLVSAELGEEATHDNNGDVLRDGELYLVTREGIFPVADELEE